MTPVLVDSNVILDVAANDSDWSDWSSTALLRAANDAVLVLTRDAARYRTYFPAVELIAP